MNIFKKSLEEIQSNNGLLVERIDLLPGVPEKLSLNETAYVLGVSVQTIERMIGTGDLTLTPDGDVLKAGLESYILCHALADIPILDDAEIPEYPTISRKNPDKI